MSTQRSKIIAAVFTALDGAGKPAGLSVVRRTPAAIEADALPRLMVSRVAERTLKGYPNQLRSPLSDRHLTVRLDFWVTDTNDPEEALEPMLAWATATMLSTPAWGGLAMDTTEDSTDWDTEQADMSLGHAWMDFTIRFPTKTADQEQKQ